MFNWKKYRRKLPWFAFDSSISTQLCDILLERYSNVSIEHSSGGLFKVIPTDYPDVDFWLSFRVKYNFWFIQKVELFPNRYYISHRIFITKIKFSDKLYGLNSLFSILDSWHSNIPTFGRFYNIIERNSVSHRNNVSDIVLKLQQYASQTLIECTLELYFDKKYYDYSIHIKAETNIKLSIMNNENVELSVEGMGLAGDYVFRKGLTADEIVDIIIGQSYIREQKLKKLTDD
jgi:hypothetical protein